jgi:hypothetical protein
LKATVKLRGKVALEISLNKDQLKYSDDDLALWFKWVEANEGGRFINYMGLGVVPLLPVREETFKAFIRLGTLYWRSSSGLPYEWDLPEVKMKVPDVRDLRF